MTNYQKPEDRKVVGIGQGRPEKRQPGQGERKPGDSQLGTLGTTREGGKPGEKRPGDHRK